MRKKICLTILFILFGSLAFADAPKRIVSLKPNITSIIYALGAEDRLVGVTTFCDRPEAAKKLPKVADYTKPFLERLIAAKPDLVIGSKEQSSKRAYGSIESLGVHVGLFDFGNLDQTLSSIEKIAGLIGEKKKGKSIVEGMTRSFDKIRARYKGSEKKKVLIVWGYRPLVIAGRGNFMDEILAMLDAVNVGAKSGSAYPHWSIEEVITADPDVIIDLSRGMGGEGSYDWKSLNVISAVKSNRVFNLDASDFQMSPNITGSVERLGKLIHGE
ncbi:MAG: helical backbone metal receptor [Pseudomonadota bacterium]